MGVTCRGLILDIDATLVTCHWEKEQAAATHERDLGYHPLQCFLDNTGEALTDHQDCFVAEFGIGLVVRVRLGADQEPADH